MQILHTVRQLQSYCHGKDIAFIPTMGYLHEGHLSLVRQAAHLNSEILVSIFVNPLQFHDPTDYEKYPRNSEHDLALLSRERVGAVFLPTVQEIYPRGYPKIRLWHPLMAELCGKYRPGHFEGVLYIVHNLFMWVRPRYALFGKKDYQQLRLIQAMNEELSLGVQIIPCATVRDKDGLAMSSRNARLTQEGRKLARIIPLALHGAAKLAQEGASADAIAHFFSEKLSSFRWDYAGAFDPHTLSPLRDKNSCQNALLALAVYIEGVRLIDNVLTNDKEALNLLEKLVGE
ncbi:MAG: pantoate--beta-alanine ligase [Leptospiraceae bacterium]|nr:pantoate--beta-alanine ligase [Leptospiraceae bacterium]MDW8307212.1 pantoate--beta-alanine ligase [Leptospiraceae bacterium]